MVVRTDDSPLNRIRGPRVLRLATQPALRLGPSPRLRYVRKSTTKAERQEMSHEQQIETMDARWGPRAEEYTWRESHTGTTFDRPVLNHLLTVCAANPQPPDQPGTIELYDPSRFGRPLTSDGREDIFAFMYAIEQFKAYGWVLAFTNVKLTSETYIDALLMVSHAWLAANFSVKLRRETARGKAHHTATGRWIHGTAPFPSERWDDEVKRFLQDGEETRPGQHGTLLGIRPERKALWEECARAILQGYSLDAVGAQLTERDVAAPRKGRWGHSSVRNMLTNRALIGIIETTHRTEAMDRVSLVTVAKWEPLVDVGLFRAVEQELERRGKRKHGHRRRRERFPLEPRCSACGIVYTGGSTTDRHGVQSRAYTHPTPSWRADPEARAKIETAGCLRWYVDAETLESGVRDLIASEDFEVRLRALIASEEGVRVRARGDEVALREKMASAEKRGAALVGLQVRAVDQGIDPTAYDVALKEAQRESREARKCLEKLRTRVAAADQARDAFTATIEETRALLAIWPSLSVVERRVVFREWVLALLIVTEPTPGMRRANRKTAIAFLKSDPFSGAAVALDGHGSANESAEPASSFAIRPPKRAPRAKPSSQGECAA